MREIKFRAWEAIEKRFLSWDEIQENTIQDVFRLFDCQQFTGFKDEQGREIYDGDILREEEGYAVAAWDKRNGSWGFFLVEDDGTFPWSEGTLSDWKDAVEIIGNIHENADLLLPVTRDV